MEASSTRLMTYRGFSPSLPDFSAFARSSPEPVAVRFFLDCYKDSGSRQDNLKLSPVQRVPHVKREGDKKAVELFTK